MEILQVLGTPLKGTILKESGGFYHSNFGSNQVWQILTQLKVLLHHTHCIVFSMGASMSLQVLERNALHIELGLAQGP